MHMETEAEVDGRSLRTVERLGTVHLSHLFLCYVHICLQTCGQIPTTLALQEPENPERNHSKNRMKREGILHRDAEHHIHHSRDLVIYYDLAFL